MSRPPAPASTPSGRRVRCGGGYAAHVPDPLPPALVWSPTLVRALSDADRMIGRLAGEGGRLPNPHVLIRPFIRREAVLSSRIEGTQATLGELLAAEAGVVVERSPEDLREVGNYVAALEYGVRRLKKLLLSLRLVRELHAKLMAGVRGGQATPGEFRRSQNWIGPPGCTLATATYIPPPPPEMMACLEQWETFLHDRSLPPLIQIALAHYQFEAIHPFLDGNVAAFSHPSDSSASRALHSMFRSSSRCCSFRRCSSYSEYDLPRRPSRCLINACRRLASCIARR